MRAAAVCGLLRYTGRCGMRAVAVCGLLRYAGCCGMRVVAVCGLQAHTAPGDRNRQKSKKHRNRQKIPEIY